MKRKTESVKASAQAGLPAPGQVPLLYPQGIEVLLRRAASDPEFREQLLEQRAGAAAAIGLELDPAEKAMLESIPSAQLLLTIERLEAAGERRRGFLVKLAVAVAMAAAASGVWFWVRREPFYKGKGLNEWLALGERFGWGYNLMAVAVRGVMAAGVGTASGYPARPSRPVSRVAPKPEMSEVEEALHAMGTKAVPPMMALLETKDPAWKLKLMAWLGKQSAVRVHFTKAETYQKRALIGLTVLGPLATNAVPVIQKAMAETNKVNDWEFQAYAKEALEKITGTNSIP